MRHMLANGCGTQCSEVGGSQLLLPCLEAHTSLKLRYGRPRLRYHLSSTSNLVLTSRHCSSNIHLAHFPVTNPPMATLIDHLAANLFVLVALHTYRTKQCTKRDLFRKNNPMDQFARRVLAALPHNHFLDRRLARPTSKDEHSGEDRSRSKGFL